MDTEIEKRVRETYGDLTPSEETDRAVIEEVARCTQVAPVRRRWEFAVAAAAAVVLAIVLLLPEETDPTLPAAPGLRPGESPPLASTLSVDGRFRLDITHLEVEPPAPGSVANPKVKVQGRVVVEGPRRVVGPLVKVRRVTTPDGSDRTPEGFGYVDQPDARGGSFAIHDIDLGPEPTRIALLELETSILRLRDRDHRFEGIEPGEPVQRTLPPYVLTLHATQNSLGITCFFTEESLRAANARLKDSWLGNRAVAGSARVVDAEGKDLTAMGGGDSGGYATIMYGPGYGSESSISYPVSITIPDPNPVERIPAAFRFRDLSLPPVRDRHVSDSPWSEPSGGLRMRADLPTRVEQGERVVAVIEITRENSGLPPGVTRLETRDAEEFLTLRLTPVGGGEATSVRPEDWTQGMPYPPEPGAPVPNLSTDPPPVRTHFPLARVREAVSPGRYEGVVELAIPAPERRRPLFEVGLDRLWHGTLRSGVFPIEIVAEPKRTRRLKVPKQLRLVKGLRLTFLTEDIETVEVPRRNGHYLGTIITFDGGDDGRTEISGLLPPDDPNPLLTVPPDHEGPYETTVTVTVFRTIEPPAHHWPRPALDEILWRRTIEVRYTAEEIDALR